MVSKRVVIQLQEEKNAKHFDGFRVENYLHNETFAAKSIGQKPPRITPRDKERVPPVLISYVMIIGCDTI